MTLPILKSNSGSSVALRNLSSLYLKQLTQDKKAGIRALSSLFEMMDSSKRWSALHRMLPWATGLRTPYK